MRLPDLLDGLGSPVTFYPSLVPVLGGVDETLFLCQLAYWTGKQRDPDGWVYKTMREWERETGLSARKQVRVRKSLKKAGLVEEHRKSNPSKLHFRLRVERLKTLWGEYSKDADQEEKNALTKNQRPDLTGRERNVRTKSARNAETLIGTESTSRSTSAITAESTHPVRFARDVPTSTNQRQDDVLQRDAVRLCSLLEDLVKASGARPTPGTGAAREAAVRLLREPGRSLDEAERVATWAQGNEFWRSRTMKMENLLKSYDTVRLQMEAESKSKSPSSQTIRRANDGSQHPSQMMSGLDVLRMYPLTPSDGPPDTPEDTETADGAPVESEPPTDR